MGTIILLVLGVFILVVSFIAKKQEKELLHDSVTTTGTVVEIMRYDMRKYGVIYKPMVEFWVNGKRVIFVSKSVKNESDYKVGQKVSVRYSKTDDQNAEIAERIEKHVLSGKLRMAGIGIIVISIILLQLGINIDRCRSCPVDQKNDFLIEVTK